MTTGAHHNRLAQETSPYLLAHADNPVDWYPWNAAALERARREDRPILLSIGYSACHWCHVMAHESFEDAATARVMNDLFVNIKVDREERPDLDKIYQSAFQLLNRRPGGWPLTVFLTPGDQVPFFAATYVPRTARYGMPAFGDLLRRVAQAYRDQKAAIQDQNQAVLAALRQAPTTAAERPGPALLDSLRDQLWQRFDAVNGGFGEAPKFPQPSNLEWLLRHWQRTNAAGAGDGVALEMVSETLHRMARGGVYDQLGGGFYRYSVDARWEIPHFEKMLYDNGPLLALYAAAWSTTGEPLFRRIAEETAHWLSREMRAPEGFFYASLDADSEGHEGRFYCWQRDAVQATLSPAEFEVFATCYGLDGAANFEGDWHLTLVETPEHLAQRLGRDPTVVEELVVAARDKLYQLRRQRVWPARDEKILTAWNALAIEGLATAGRLLDRPDLIATGATALAALRQRVWQDGRLRASYKDERVGAPGFLDDYAYLLTAVLSLLEARWAPGELDFARVLADRLLDHFEDPAGGFYFTADDHEALIQRPKPVFDDAHPSGNGVAALALMRLGRLLGEVRYLDAADRTLCWAQPWLEQAPLGCAALMTALEQQLYPDATVILRGPAATVHEWHRHLAPGYAPRRLILTLPERAPDLPGQPAGPDGAARAYVCHGDHCSAPIADLAGLQRTLAAGQN